MVGYGQFCPVAKTSELICERWMPLILRELMCGSHRFSEIQRGVPLISPALLSKRLRQLELGGVIERTRRGHGWDCTLTEAGWELYPVIEAMGVWGQRWARSRYTPDELDPSLLMWDVRRMLSAGGLRERRTVVEVRFRRAPTGKSTYWLVVDDDIDLCLVDPGYAVDLYVRAELRALTEVWMGDRTMCDALATGTIELEGPRALVDRFPAWLGTHPVLGTVGPARTGAAVRRSGSHRRSS
jgi:DNA-binding HxlR family transcriptional regulator